MRTGRPPKYREAMVKDAELLAGLGFTKQDFCAYWHINRDTLHRWERKRGELSDAIKRGQLHANVSVTKSLFNAAQQGNITACIFWLKNRAGWKDEQVIPPSQPVQLVQFIETNGAHNTSSRVSRLDTPVAAGSPPSL